MGDSRNERMGERGEGRGTMSARSAPPLEPKTAALVRIAAAIAAGKTAELELKRRELCTVAAVAVLGTAPQQLHSHLRGALNTGATREEVEAVLALIEGDLDPVHRQRAHDQWADVKKRKV